MGKISSVRTARGKERLFPGGHQLWIGGLLWAELCPQNPMLKSSSLVPQNVIAFGDRVFKRVVMLK